MSAKHIRKCLIVHVPSALREPLRRGLSVADAIRRRVEAAPDWDVPLTPSRPVGRGVRVQLPRRLLARLEAAARARGCSAADLVISGLIASADEALERANATDLRIAEGEIRQHVRLEPHAREF